MTSSPAASEHVAEPVGGRSTSPSPLARLLMFLVTLYQRTAIVRAPRCRFHPTCSQYAVDSLRVHGAIRGAIHAIARVLRCHPWHPGGLDPVKPPTARKK